MTEQPKPTPEIATPETPKDSADAAAATARPDPAEATAKKGPSNPFIWGTGRRKSAVARVRIRPGEGKFLINEREIDDYFRVEPARQAVRTPLKVAGAERTYDIFVRVDGGGPTGQSGAIMLGLARALAVAEPQLAPKLKEQRLLTRDPRRVERKKYGQAGARRRFQFSKR